MQKTRGYGQTRPVQDDQDPAETTTAPPAAPQEARTAGGLPLVALDQVLFPRQCTHTADELVALTGVDLEVATRLWRAMGFTAVPDDSPIFVDDDLEALRSAMKALSEGVPLNEIIYQTRVISAAMARAAEVTSDNFVTRVEELHRLGLSEDEIVKAIGDAEQQDIDHLIGYFYRRQLREAIWRKMAQPEHQPDRTATTVAFIDLVAFTAITEDIAQDQLGALIDRFEMTVHDRVTTGGGRIVKMIGDEVMFVSDDASGATDIALDLIDAFSDDDSVPEARAGLATGSVLAHGGDYFGPVVNLASRIVGVARPSTVVVSDAVHEQLAGRTDLNWRHLPPKWLKGIGRSTLWRVGR
jgi:adenylate cyclase